MAIGDTLLTVHGGTDELINFPPNHEPAIHGSTVWKGPHNTFSILVGFEGVGELVPATTWVRDKNDNLVQVTNTPEIMLVTNIDNDLAKFTVQRAQENTTAFAWPQFTPFQMLPYYRKWWPHYFISFGGLALPVS
jgi:hypothetical protein